MSSKDFSKTVAIVRGLGVDVDRVSVFNLDTTGYDEFVLDANGNRVLTPKGNMKTVRREWPSLADGIRVVDQFIKDGGYEQ